MLVTRLANQMKVEVLAASSIFAFYTVIRNVFPPSSAAFFASMYVFILVVVYTIGFTGFADEEEDERRDRYENRGYFAKRYYYHQILGLDDDG